MQESKRNRMSDLFCASVDNPTIANIIGVHQRTVRRFMARFMADESMAHKPRGPVTNKIRTANFVEIMMDIVEENPTIRIREAAHLAGVGTMTASRAIHDDLGLKSFSRTPKHLLTARQKAIRLERSKKLLTWLKHNGSTVKNFSDKKNFSVDQSFNHCNDRYLAKDKSDVKAIMTMKHQPLSWSWVSGHQMARRCLPSSFPAESGRGQRSIWRCYRLW